MFEIIAVLIFVIVIISIPLFKMYLKLKLKNGRKNIQNKAFPEKWERYLKDNIELYNHMPDKLKERLKKDVLVFINEKEFIGCVGLEITDEMKVVVAAQAMILLLGEVDPQYYPKLWRIELYPSAYKAMVNNGTVVEENIRLGESWLNGRMILSWDHSKQGKYKWKDGQSVVLHEFAHQLDQLDGDADGVPTLKESAAYSIWSDNMSREYRKMLEDIEKDHKTVLDRYGATNPAEFFAVATETFFEKSIQMQKKMPEIYDVLRSFYKLDPAKWLKK